MNPGTKVETFSGPGTVVGVDNGWISVRLDDGSAIRVREHWVFERKAPTSPTTTGLLGPSSVTLVISGMSFELSGPEAGISYLVSHLQILTNVRIYNARGEELSAEPPVEQENGVWKRPSVSQCGLRLMSEVLEEEKLIGQRVDGFGSCASGTSSNMRGCQG